MKILVRMPNWIGDFVMATPVLVDLRKAFPKASITAMCQTPLGALLEKEMAIDEIFSFQKLSFFSYRKEKRDIVEKIRKGSFDAAILLPNSFSSAWLIWQANIPRRIGYKGHFRKWLLTDPVVKPEKKLHQVELYKDLLLPLDVPSSTTKPRLILLDEEIEEMKQMLVCKGYESDMPLIAIHPGAAYGSAKRWPLENFHKLIQHLSKKAFILILGDQTVAHSFLNISSRVINLGGITSLRQLMAASQLSKLLITNDSGPMHIGAALGTPLIALFGSTDPVLTGPYGNLSQVIHKKVACSPCFKRECPIDLRCMTQITIEEVLHKANICLRK